MKEFLELDVSQIPNYQWEDSEKESLLQDC